MLLLYYTSRRKIKEGRAKLPVEKQQEINANIILKREEFKDFNFQKLLYEAANKNTLLYFVTKKEWTEIIQLKLRAFKREKTLNRKDELKGSIIISKHASQRMTQRGITMWDMANNRRVIIIYDGKRVLTTYRK